MKKLMIAAAIVCAATFANAATVKWTGAGMAGYSGDAVACFIINMNGVTSIDQIEKMIAKGDSISSYAFDIAAVAGNGSLNKATDTSKTVGEGTWTSFLVLFNATDQAHATKFVTVDGIANQTKNVGTSTAAVTFAVNNVSSIVNTTSNWQAINVPEPTSGLLLVLGLAGLALRRRRA